LPGTTGRAIDTNVAARYLLGDDAQQTGIATAIIEAGVLVSTTVLLELGWLLGSRIGLPRGTIAAVLSQLIDLDSVYVDDIKGVSWAIARYAEGGDLADMIHLIAAAPAVRFATFDKGIVRSAGPDAPIAVETLG